MSTEGTLKQRILKYIRDYDHVTFAELHRVFGDEFSGKGNNLEIAKDSNIVLWSGLTREGLMSFAPANPLTYLIDGSGLNLPVVKSASYKYKRPHWLPVTMRPAPANV
jgi:hypothetical protein